MISDAETAASPSKEPAVEKNAAPIKAIPIEAWGTEMLTPVGPPACDPAKPWVCDVYAVGTANATGTIVGEGPIIARHHWDLETNSLWVSRYITFHGSVVGCGTGSFDLYLEGHIAPDVNGAARLVGRGMAVPGSGTGELAGVVEYNFPIDQSAEPAAGHMPFAHFTGTMYCG